MDEGPQRIERCAGEKLHLTRTARLAAYRPEQDRHPGVAITIHHFRLQKRENMKAATLVGILLIILGIAGFAMGGVSFTHEKKDVDLGPVQLSHKQKDTLPISPILSTLALVGGIGLLVAGSRK